MKAGRSIDLPAGVKLTSLKTHSDSRGDLTEIFRNEWQDSPEPVQWLVSRTEANALRGVHAHVRHWDYYCVVAGELIIGLHDLRPTASTPRSLMLRLSAEQLQLAAVPTGVAHGLYSPGRSIFMVGTSEYYDPADDLGCRWDSPELAMDWPCAAPVLSIRDRDAGGYAEFRAAFLADLAAI